MCALTFLVDRVSVHAQHSSISVIIFPAVTHSERGELINFMNAGQRRRVGYGFKAMGLLEVATLPMSFGKLCHRILYVPKSPAGGIPY